MNTRRAGATLLWALLGVLGILPPMSALATVASATGVGPKSQALAGAGAGLETGYEASFVNPATLGLVTHPALSAGYQVTDTRLYSQRSGEPERRFETERLRATLLGFALPLAFGDERLVLGLASSSPGGFVARADLPLEDEPQFPLLVSQRQALEFDLALGLRPWRLLALGAGLRALSTLSGTAAVERDGERSSTSVESTLEPALAPVLGVSTFLADSAVLSLVFRGPLRADFDIQLAAVDLGATELPAMSLSGVAHYDPLSLELEYAHRFGQLWTIAGVSYRRYRDTPTLLPRTVACPPERPECLALDAAPPGFHDTFELHGAASYRVALTSAATAQLRAGYAYVPSPVPEQVAASNLLDAARHRLGLGYGVALAAPLPGLELDLAAQLEKLAPREHHKAESVATNNAGWPRLATRGFIASATLGVTMRLE